MSNIITKSSKKKDKRQVNEQFRKGIQGWYKKQKRQDWAYHDALSAIYWAVAQ